MRPVYAALVHHPVLARDGSVVTTAVTNLDVHDIARTCRTYEVAGYFIVTPITAQRELVHKILAHWREGAGGRRIPERADALGRVRVVVSVEEAEAAIAAEQGGRPHVVTTAARAIEGKAPRSFAEERARMRESDMPTLILFGTGHGLGGELIARADGLLEPIAGRGGYNHLSVRAAAAITFDRLLGRA